MAPPSARRGARRGARASRPPGPGARSAEDWWWDRLAPRGSGYHLMQADSMLLVLPGLGPARPGRGLGRPPSPGSPGAHFRAAGGRRRAHAVPRQGRARLPPVAPSRLPARALAHRHPVAPPGWPRLQKPCRGREEAPGLPGVAPAQSVLAAAAADPPPLEVSGTLRAEGEPHSVHLGLASASKEWPPDCSTGRPACSWGFPALPSPPSREVPELVSECCPRLTFLKLSDCHNVPADALIMLARACSRLHSLDLQHSMVDSTAVVSFLEEMGPRMLKLWITYSSQTTAILGALLGSRCPRLQVLEVSTGINPSRTPLQLPVEALQRGCPQLQVLRLLNLIWMPKPSGRGVAPGPGFPHLEELCLAGSTCTFVNNEVLGRLLHGSPNLRLLDLRGCDRITPTGLHDLPCQELEQLHLGLFGMSDRLTLAKEGSPLLTQKWYHSLRELDLSGQGFSEKDLEQALAAFSGCPVPPALRVLNLRGTRVTPGVVSSVISSCPGLLYLNLESCRCLPRGLKRVYRGLEEVQRCLEQLCTSPSPPASLA